MEGITSFELEDVGVVRTEERAGVSAGGEGRMARRMLWIVLIAAPCLACSGRADLGEGAGHHSAAVQPVARPQLVDRILVDKSDRRLSLLLGEEEVASFPVALGREPQGHKQFSGDGKTPEGRYIIDARNPNSRFHRSLQISYPDASDQLNAMRAGRSPGGQIMIHGLPEELLAWNDEHHLFDWTEGCIAVTNDEMDLIWETVALGTPIEITP